MSPIDCVSVIDFSQHKMICETGRVAGNFDDSCAAALFDDDDD